jgi:hypothetical protein
LENGEGLNCPGFSLADGFAEQIGDLLGTQVAEERLAEALFVLEPAPGNPGRIARLAWLPAVPVSGLKLSCWIARLSGLKFTVVCHEDFSELVSRAAFETLPGSMGGKPPPERSHPEAADLPIG